MNEVTLMTFPFEQIGCGLGISVWSVVVLYLILRLIRLFQRGNKEQLLRVNDLLGAARDEKQDGIAQSAGRLSSICCLALGITAALTAGSNLVQIALMRWLSDISVTVNIPVVSLAFTVMILLFSRLLVENKALRDDNDLFI